MAKICVLLTAFGLGLSVVGGAGHDGIQPPLAHFHFNGNASNVGKGDAEFELSNTVFNAHSLYLNGQYELGDENGFRAVCRTPYLSYAAFTVGVRFKAEEFAAGKTSIVVGGTAARWFGMHRAESGNLTITLNNQDQVYEVKDAPLVEGKWIAVACGVDLPARRIVAYIDGREAARFELSKDFALQVVGSDAERRDKVWSFADYSNGNVFHGFVDELIIHNRVLTDDEFQAITRPRPPDADMGNAQKAARRKDGPQQFATVSGRVMSNAGEFLNDVRVTVAIPDDDPEKPVRKFKARTGVDGTYSMQVPVDPEYDLVDVEFIKKGFRASDSVTDNGGPIVMAVLQPGQTADVSYVLDGSPLQFLPPVELPSLQDDDPRRIVGRVLGLAGKPLPNVAIRVAVPATDMRQVHEGSGQRIFKARTKEDGTYEIQLPKTTRSASVDAMTPGYRSASGAILAGGDIRNCRFRRGGTAHASFALQGPALYVRGVVTDETGAPVSGAKVVAMECHTGSEGYISVGQTNEAGEFEVFDYGLSPLILDDEKGRGEIAISHDNYEEQVIRDVYSQAKDGQVTLKVVLSRK